MNVNQIDKADQDTVRDHLKTIKDETPNQETIFTIFNKWQSDKLRSIKRFLISISFLISIIFFFDIDLTSVEFFEIAVPEQRIHDFTLFLTVMLVLSYLYFEYLRKFDWNIRKAKLESIQERIDNVCNATTELENIAKKYKISRNRIIRLIINHGTLSYIKNLDVIDFYREKIENHFLGFNFIIRLELYLMRTFYYLAFISSICLYYGLNYSILFK